MADTKWTVACATEDGHNLVNAHFGQAAFYALYTLDEDGFERVGDVPNPTPPDVHTHGGAHKATNIAGQLEERGVKVVVSLQFGPNIARMRKRFVPVVSKDVVTLQDVMEALYAKRSDIARELAAGESRHALLLKPDAV